MIFEKLCPESAHCFCLCTIKINSKYIYFFPLFKKCKQRVTFDLLKSVLVLAMTRGVAVDKEPPSSPCSGATEGNDEPGCRQGTAIISLFRSHWRKWWAGQPQPNMSAQQITCQRDSNGFPLIWLLLAIPFLLLAKGLWRIAAFNNETGLTTKIRNLVS